jgi:hypothetical protein
LDIERLAVIVTFSVKDVSTDALTRQNKNPSPSSSKSNETFDEEAERLDVNDAGDGTT